MTNSKDVIIKLKDIKEEKGLSLGDIMELIEKNGEFVSKTTLSRVFADGSEEVSFRYEETLRPIANALLDIETIEAEDDLDTQALKIMLQYKAERIKELEHELNYEKLKHHEKMEKERDQSRKSIEFLKEQITLKDKRMDQLLRALFEKDVQAKEMLSKLLACQHCPIGHKKED